MPAALDRIPGFPTRLRRAIDGIGSDFVPYTGAIKDVDLGSFDLTTTGLGTFGDVLINSPVNIYLLSHDSFADFVGNEHIDHTAVTMTAGTGLTGGGTIATTRTFDADFTVIQAQGDVLDDLNTLGVVSNNGEFLVGTELGAFAWESGATVRNSLELGTGDSVTFNIITAVNQMLVSGNFATATRSLRNSGNQIVVDWAGSRLYDTPGVLAINFESRQLLANDGADVILDWDTVGTADFGNSLVTTTGDMAANALSLTNDVSTITFGDTGLTDTLQMIGGGTLLNTFIFGNAGASNDLQLLLTGASSTWVTAKDLLLTSSDESLTFRALTAGKTISLNTPIVQVSTQLDVNGTINIPLDAVASTWGVSADAQIQYIDSTGLKITDTTTGLVYFDDDDVATLGNIGIGTLTPDVRLKIISSTQYDGFILHNGTYDVVQFLGFSGTNDQGGIKIFAGGVALIQLVAFNGSFFHSGTVDFGSASHYARFAGDGELALVGTARVEIEMRLALAGTGGGASKPTLDESYAPFDGWRMGINDDLHYVFELPTDADPSENVEFHIHWYINEARTGSNEEVNWQIIYRAIKEDGSEAVDSGGSTATISSGDTLIPTTAKALLETSVGTIVAANIDQDDVIGINLSRIAIIDGTNPTAFPIITAVEVHYTKNKLGIAT